MPAETLNLSSDPRVGTQQVYLKTKWSDPWVFCHGLDASELTWAVLPNIGQAILERPFGLGMFPGDVVASYKTKLSILNQLVKVVYTPADSSLDPLVWIGVVGISEQQRYDRVNDNGLSKFGGLQVFRCFDLAYVLDRTPITKGYFYDDTSAVEVGDARPFNEDGVPNRSNLSDGGLYRFSKLRGEDHAAFWSTTDAVSYLCDKFQPQVGTETGSAFPLVNADEFLQPSWDKPEVAQHGASLLEVLSSFLSYERGLGAWLEVDETETPAQVKVRTFTYTATDLNLGGEEGETLAANQTQWSLVVDYRPDLHTAIKLSSVDNYSRVVLQGNHRRAVATFDPQPGAEDFVADWVSADVTLYDAGASTQGDYAALSLSLKQQRNEDVRESQKLSHVFSRFRIKDDWDGKSACGTSIDAEDRVPVLRDDEDPTKVYGNWPAGRRLLQSLPLREGVDYSGSAIADGDIPTVFEESVPYMPPMWFFQSKTDTDKWFEAHSGALGSRAAAENRKWSASIRCDQELPKFRGIVQGAHQHIIADGEFTPLTGVDESEVRYRWYESLATLCLQESRYVTVTYPETLPDDGANIPFITTKHINIGPGFCADYITPQTVVGIDPDTNELLRSDGGFARDDRPKMEAMAQQYYLFYSTPRRVLHIEKVGPTKELWLGEYVKQLGAEGELSDLVDTIGTCVTHISVSFPQGTVGSPAGPPVQTWQTAQGELDALAVTPNK